MARETPPLISKSRYLSGLLCPKLLWCHYNDREIFPPVDPVRQAIFDQGHRVGEMARDLFPGGLLISGERHRAEEVVPETHRHLPLRVPLFEAGFVYRNAYARVDVLEPVEADRWDLYEVKSSTRVKNEHIPDVAFQRHILAGAGVEVRSCYLLHVDNQYVLQGELDLGRFFNAEDVTEETAGLLPAIDDDLERMTEVVLSERCPEVGIGVQCTSPYECSLKSVCWDFLPEDSVTTLHGDRAKGFKLLERGVTELRELPEDVFLTGKQRIQVEALRSQRVHLSRPEVQQFLAGLEYPIHYLDFETFMPAIPLLDGTRPYQQIPFQFSCHVVGSPQGASEHHSCLAEESQDPRTGLLAELRRAIRPTGSVVVYNAPFERGVLRDLAATDDDLFDWWEDLDGRLVDLFAPFRSFHAYHPEQHGSASMKDVLPAFTGLDYGHLPIADGMAASTEYFRVTYTDVPEEERVRVYRELREYCDLDTEGMMRIVERLRDLVG